MSACRLSRIVWLSAVDTDWDWEAERRPVIHLNMGKCAAAVK